MGVGRGGRAESECGALVFLGGAPTGPGGEEGRFVPAAKQIIACQID